MSISQYKLRRLWRLAVALQLSSAARTHIRVDPRDLWETPAHPVISMDSFSYYLVQYSVNSNVIV